MEGNSIKPNYREPFNFFAEIKEGITGIDAKKPLNSEFETGKAAIVCDDSNRKSCKDILERGRRDLNPRSLP